MNEWMNESQSVVVPCGSESEANAFIYVLMEDEHLLHFLHSSLYITAWRITTDHY